MNTGSKPVLTVVSNLEVCAKLSSSLSDTTTYVRMDPKIKLVQKCRIAKEFVWKVCS